MRIIYAVVFSLLLVGQSSPAMACGKNEYKCGLFGCCPKIGGSVGQAAEGLKDLVNKGDAAQLAQPLGDSVIALGCPGCAVLGNAFVKKADRAKISQIIGYGTIVANPVGFVVVATNEQGQAVNKATLAPPPAPPFPTPIKEYSAGFTCLIEAPHESGARQVIAIHSGDIVASGPDGEIVIPPNNIGDGSIVNATAPLCPDYSMGNDQRTISSARFKVIGACAPWNQNVGSKEKPLFVKMYCVGILQ